MKYFKIKTKKRISWARALEIADYLTDIVGRRFFVDDYGNEESPLQAYDFCFSDNEWDSWKEDTKLLKKHYPKIPFTIEITDWVKETKEEIAI